MIDLPSDIIVEIFSFLTQQDSLTCMAVCRDWYNSIPQYAKDLWKELQLEAEDTFENYQRREKCLGIHVKSVVIRADRSYVCEDDLYTLMHMLSEWGCNNIQCFEFINLSVDDHLLLTSLQELAPQLKQLKLTKCKSTTAPTCILDAHSDLTHLICRDSKFWACYDSDGIAVASKSTAYRPTKVTHLLLDAIVPEKGQVNQILERCPNLESFIGISQYLHQRRIYDASDWPTPIDLDLLFSLCPKVTFFSVDYDNDDILQQFLKCSKSSFKSQEGLRYLELSASYGLHQLEHHLIRSQQTLEHLSLNAGPEDDSSLTLPSLEFPKLRTIRFIYHGYTIDSIFAILNHSPALEKLDMSHPPGTHLPVTQPLDPMHHLRTLIWRLPVSKGGFSIFTFLEQCPVLQDLFIDGLVISLDLPNGFTGLNHLQRVEISYESHNLEHTAVADMSQFFKHLADNANVKKVKVTNVDLDYETLRTIASIPTLEDLCIGLEPDLDEEKVARFFQLLNQAAIKSLTVHNVCRLSFAALNILSELPKLVNLTVSPKWSGMNTTRTYINKHGLEQLLCTCSPTLTTILLNIHVILIEEDESLLMRKQVEEMLQQQRNSSTRRWDIQVTGYSPLTQALLGATIRRI